MVYDANAADGWENKTMERLERAECTTDRLRQITSRQQKHGNQRYYDYGFATNSSEAGTMCRACQGAHTAHTCGKRSRSVTDIHASPPTTTTTAAAAAAAPCAARPTEKEDEGEVEDEEKEDYDDDNVEEEKAAVEDDNDDDDADEEKEEEDVGAEERPRSMPPNLWSTFFLSTV